MANNDMRPSGANRPPNKMMLSRTLVMFLVCGIAAFIVLGIKLYSIQMAG